MFVSWEVADIGLTPEQSALAPHLDDPAGQALLLSSSPPAHSAAA